MTTLTVDFLQSLLTWIWYCGDYLGLHGLVLGFGTPLFSHPVEDSVLEGNYIWDYLAISASAAPLNRQLVK